MNFVSRVLFIMIISGIIAVSGIHAAELSVPSLEVKAGQSFELPVMLDSVENLAGVKLAIEYDPEIMIFKKADKTKQTSSLMHIVNNKKPGMLIIVMAGARGIQGKNFPIISLHFEAGKDIKEKKTLAVKFAEIQLMSDKLKDIPYKITVAPLTVLPGEKLDLPAKAGEKPEEEPGLMKISNNE